MVAASGAEKDLAGRSVVLFDFDGTLADSVGAIVATARTALLANGFPEEELGDVGRIVGPPFPHAFTIVYGLSDEQAARVTATYRSIYLKIGRDAWPFFDGTAELLERLRAAGKRLGVASSKRQEMIRQALADNEATDLFDLAFGKVNDEAETKAHIIGRALEKLGATPADAVMVGDRHYDVEAAAEWDIPCVGLTYGGGTRRELEEAGAAVIADSVEELGRVLLG